MHHFKNFKGFEQAQLELMRPFSLLIGRNGSGKSNVIEGVELLSHIAHGRPLFEIVDVGRGSAGGFEVRGGLDGCIRTGAWEKKFELGFSAFIRFDGKDVPFQYWVALGNRGATQKVFSESLVVGDRTLFSASLGNGGDILDVVYDNFARGRTKPTTHLAADRSVLARYGSFAPISEPKKSRAHDAYGVVQGVENHLKAAFVFDPHPRLMRGYARMGQESLVKDGSNLSSVLHTLSLGAAPEQEKLSAILKRISQFPEEPFSSFEFITTQLNDVILALQTGDGTRVDARLLSDGTLRALAILTALETVPEQSRIVIEELDNGIHPSRVSSLIEALWESAHRRKLNVLATTHNPATLDCLDEKQLQSVVIAHTDSGTKTSRLTPLPDLPRSEILLEPGQLGGLVTRQTLERFLDSSLAGAHKARMTAWLESLA